MLSSQRHNENGPGANIVYLFFVMNPSGVGVLVYLLGWQTLKTEEAAMVSQGFISAGGVFLFPFQGAFENQRLEKPPTCMPLLTRF